MDEEDELFQQLTQCQPLAHVVFVRAIIATHPNPELLRAAVDIYLKDAKKFISDEGWGPLPTELFDRSVNSLLEHIGVASAPGAA
jgi:hypothetical protein